MVKKQHLFSTNMVRYLRLLTCICLMRVCIYFKGDMKLIVEMSTKLVWMPPQILVVMMVTILVLLCNCWSLVR